MAVIPTAKASQIISINDDTKVKDIVSKIMMLESSGGKNNYSKCAEVGEFNRYGYGIPGNGNYICFQEGDDTDAVELWVNQHIAEGLTLGEMLCHYNTGSITESCNYYKKYLTL